MHRRAFLILLPAGVISACAPAPGGLSLAPGSTLLVVRHGDRDGEDLNAKGLQRAEALVDAVAAFETAGHELSCGGVDASCVVAERERRSEADQRNGHRVASGGVGHQRRQRRRLGAVGR